MLNTLASADRLLPFQRAPASTVLASSGDSGLLAVWVLSWVFCTIPNEVL
jgi:hypothetical protein